MMNVLIMNIQEMKSDSRKMDYLEKNVINAMILAKMILSIHGSLMYELIKFNKKYEFNVIKINFFGELKIQNFNKFIMQGEIYRN